MAGPSLDTLPISQASAERALTAYRLSCPRRSMRAPMRAGSRGAPTGPIALRRRASWPARDARSFFVRYFETVQIADGKAFATGYYEPEIAGSRERRAGL